ncbi:hypothetical protein [Thiolapillus sp.]
MNGWRRTFVSSVLLLLFPLLATASTLMQTDMAEMSADAELIFEGRVVGTRVVGSPGGRMLRTVVTFEVLDLIKGEYYQPQLELSFVGGSRGDLKVQVSHMQIPRMGEEGIYFVEDIQQHLVNPLYGWHQGHFLLQWDRQLQQRQVTTLHGEPVFGLEKKRLATQAKMSKGPALGVLIEPRRSVDRPMNSADFKTAVRGMLQ